MRAAFGLVSILIAVAIMILIFAIYYGGEEGALRAGSKAKNQARQIAGYGEDMVRASDTITYQSLNGLPMQELEVKSVTTGGAMDVWFGLMPGDKIVAINDVNIRDLAMNDEELAKALVAEAYQRKQTLTVMRGDERVELPQAQPATPGNVPGVPGAPNATGQNPTAPPATDNRSPLQRQLDLIQQSVPTH